MMEQIAEDRTVRQILDRHEKTQWPRLLKALAIYGAQCMLKVCVNEDLTLEHIELLAYPAVEATVNQRHKSCLKGGQQKSRNRCVAFTLDNQDRDLCSPPQPQLQPQSRPPLRPPLEPPTGPPLGLTMGPHPGPHIETQTERASHRGSDAVENQAKPPEYGNVNKQLEQPETRSIPGLEMEQLRSGLEQIKTQLSSIGQKIESQGTSGTVCTSKEERAGSKTRGKPEAAAQVLNHSSRWLNATTRLPEESQARRASSKNQMAISREQECASGTKENHTQNTLAAKHSPSKLLFTKPEFVPARTSRHPAPIIMLKSRNQVLACPTQVGTQKHLGEQQSVKGQTSVEGQERQLERELEREREREREKRRPSGASGGRRSREAEPQPKKRREGLATETNQSLNDGRLQSCQREDKSMTVRFADEYLSGPIIEHFYRKASEASVPRDSRRDSRCPREVAFTPSLTYDQRQLQTAKALDCSTSISIHGAQGRTGVKNVKTATTSHNSRENTEKRRHKDGKTHNHNHNHNHRHKVEHEASERREARDTSSRKQRLTLRQEDVGRNKGQPSITEAKTTRNALAGIVHYGKERPIAYPVLSHTNSNYNAYYTVQGFRDPTAQEDSRVEPSSNCVMHQRK